MDMDLGWFADPLFFGDYPETVKKTVGADLPPLSPEDKRRIKGSLDFLGINYYTGKWVVSDGTPLGYNITDVLPAPELPGGKKFIGPLAESFWLRVVPWSFRSLLRYVDARYGGPEIMITENGVSVPKENDLSKTGECGVRLFLVYFSFISRWVFFPFFRRANTTARRALPENNKKQKRTKQNKNSGARRPLPRRLLQGLPQRDVQGHVGGRQGLDLLCLVGLVFFFSGVVFLARREREERGENKDDKRARNVFVLVLVSLSLSLSLPLRLELLTDRAETL